MPSTDCASFIMVKEYSERLLFVNAYFALGFRAGGGIEPPQGARALVARAV